MIKRFCVLDVMPLVMYTHVFKHIRGGRTWGAADLTNAPYVNSHESGIPKSPVASPRLTIYSSANRSPASIVPWCKKQST